MRGAGIAHRPRMAQAEVVIDVGDADFGREVIDRSTTTPVLVDFWAPWCGPCRTLGPLLERLADEHAGAFVLARVDVDAAPETAARYGVRSIPMLLGFRDGAAVSELVGAQPEPVLRRLIEALLPSEADRLAAEAEERAAAGDPAGARESLEKALAADPRHARALLALARLEADAGASERALALLEQVGPGTPVSDQAETLAARLRLGSGDEDAATLRARLEADPEDPDLLLDLGRALAGAGRHEEALEHLLAAVRVDPEHREAAARRAMLDLFQLLGPEHPLTGRFRSELARALYR